MAYERLSQIKLEGSDLDAFVEGALAMYSRQLEARNADDEMRFNNLVLENNLSLDDQLSYRQDQLKRITDDPKERRRISGEVSSLKDRIEQKKFSDAYLDKLISFESGITSVDSVIDWLNNQMTSATDDSVKDSIRKELVSRQQQKLTIQQNILKNQTEYAIADKTESILNKQIEKINLARNNAILFGNQESQSVYDLQLQALNKAKNEATIENELKNFAVSTMTNASSATGLLDAYNNKIVSSSSITPITIAGTTYTSAREFWTYKRDSYVADSSASGFLPRFSAEQTGNIKVKSSQGNLMTNDILNSSASYNSLLSRPELQAYSNNISIYRQDSLQTGADLLASKIYNEYLTTYDVSKALTSLDNIKSIGVNVNEIYQKILTKNAEIKAQQISGITERAGTLVTEGKAPTEAVAQASKEGAGVVVSPTQAASQSAESIAQQMAKGYEQQTVQPETRTTATGSSAPSSQPVVPAAVPNPTPTILINKQLDFGATDPQVKALQQFLNKQGFKVAESGQPGSAGYETEYFGPSTQAALQKFQASQGIVSTGTATTTGYGRLGPQTLSAIQKLFK